jgi:hypothetical protein
VWKKQTFCSKTCSAIFNNKKNGPKSEKTKQNISKSLKEYNSKHIRSEEWRKKVGEKSRQNWKNRSLEEKNKYKENQVIAVGRYTKGKYKLETVKNIFEVSSRTRTKIMKRLALPCSYCGWNDDVCDLHHSKGRIIEDAHNHKYLYCLCPNCHRLAGNKKINLEKIPTFLELIGDKWKEMYYG